MSFPDFVAKSSEHCWREFFFLPGGENLKRSYFDDLNIFQS